MRILHISDLHIRPAWQADQGKIVNAFLRDLKLQHTQEQIDAVILSGDIAFSAQADQFSFARSHLLDPIQEMLSLDRSRIIIAPGNHDVDISLIDEYAEDGMRARLSDRGSVNYLLDSESNLMRAIDRMRPWRQFHEDYYEGAEVENISPLASVHRFSVEGKSVAVVTLNSAWRATGAGDDADRAHLIVGDRQLSMAADAAAGADIRIAVMHHPIDWLAEFDQNDAKRELNKGFQILCTGHTHVNEPRAIQGTLGNLVHSAAGSLYNSREYENSYSIINVKPDLSGGNVGMRTYYEMRDDFDMAVNIAPGGEINFSFEETQQIASVAITHSSADLAASALLDTVKERSILAVDSPADANINDLLIPPVLLPLPLEQYLSASDPEEGVNAIERDDVRERLATDRHFVFVGEDSSGLTSALQWLVYQAYALDPNLTPVLVDKGEIGPGKDPLSAAVRKELALAGIPAGPRDPLPKMALAIDVTDVARTRKTQRIMEFIRAQPDHIFAIGCRRDDENLIVELLQSEGITPCTRYLGVFGRREIRSLVALSGTEHAEETVGAVLSLLKRERLPRTPSIIAALVSIVAAGKSVAQGENDTAVLEAYLGMLLGRGEEGEERDHKLDYRQRQHILSCLAEKFIRDNVRRLPRIEVERFLLDYFEAVGWSEPPGDVIKSFVARRVLVERDQKIYFRHLMFMYLLAAQGVQDSDDLRQLVLSDALLYAPVIRHVAALRRSDKELLRHVWDLYTECRDNMGLGGVDLFASTALKEGWGGDDDTAKLLSKVIPSEKSTPGDSEESERDIEDMLDQMDALFSIRDEDEEIVRRRNKFADFAESLDLMSSVLRNSELVQDIPLKSSVLRDAIEGRANFAAIISGNMREFFTSSDILEGMLRTAGVSEDDTAEIVERVMVLAPILSAWAAMADSMATARLSQGISEAMKDDNFTADPGRALLGVLFSQQINHPEWVKYAKEVLRRHGERKAVQEAIRFISTGVYMDPNTQPGRQRELEGIISSCLVSLRTFPDNAVREEVRARIGRELRNQRQRKMISPTSASGESDGLIGPGI
ncbi:metallophosphoesterase [Streptomyces sp. NPDC090088]|uniref:metallophosphoesterase n=1 Tax=Streptomyces sp. NPDC090088 TaxID=3365944 RepID=UPI003815FE74